MIKERVYQGVCVFLMIILFVVIVVTTSNYNDLQKTNEELRNTILTQQEQYTEMNDSWAESYYELQTDYSVLLEANMNLSDMYHRLEGMYDELMEEYYRYEVIKSNAESNKALNLSEEDIYLIAQCVEAEAGTIGYTTDQAQQYTCQVILNRLKSKYFPNTARGVIYQKNQFSVAHNGMMEEHAVVEQKTLDNVYKVINIGTDLPPYVQYFFTTSVQGNWVNKLNTYIVLKKTIFAYQSMEDY